MSRLTFYVAIAVSMFGGFGTASAQIASHEFGSSCEEVACGECESDRFGLPASSANSSLWEQLSFYGAIDGAKQPQDFGVNANLGTRMHVSYAAPLLADYGVGFQIGSAVVLSDNAVQVFELLGEDTQRTQSFTTIGLFQSAGDWRWGAVLDYLYQDGFDSSSLGQFRFRVVKELSSQTWLGFTGRLRAFDDTADFLGSSVTLRSINQGSVFLRHYFPTGVQCTYWLGIAGEHGESNAVTGPARPRDESFVFGADLLAPLNDHLAIYGETNLTLPGDTGTVDAMLGVVWYPFTNVRTANRKRFAPLLPVASSSTFGVDLLP
ncbi:DUF6666 family protein [Stieleria varia]|uniref:Transporter n=1 Tax=Stieleria varia TaxID=2528005 RepID=A0A5C6AQL0_9BACT|nr:DUF6666 family protein [Stieleria varia]TWU02245.1 hypothetical protein Pla52n_32950 [Stieleria varia]